MTINELYNQEVQQYIQGNIPPLLTRMRDGNVSREELKLLVDRRYQVAHFFEDWLRLIITTVQKSDLEAIEKINLAKAAEKNLQEELGEGGYGGPHKTGRSILLQALGYDPISWELALGSYSNMENLHPSSRALLDEMKCVVSIGPIEAITALWTYENQISRDGKVGDYYFLLHALEKLYPEFKRDSYSEGDVLHHIASHADHDEYHAALAKNALATITRSDTFQKIRMTYDSTRIAFDAFWNSVLD